LSGARDLLEGLAGAPRPDRERQVLAAAALWVDWPLCPLQLCGGRVVVHVTSDVFAIGSAEEPIRVPLSAPGAQTLADALGMSLVTPAISEAIEASADVLLAAMPWGPPYDESMLSIDRLVAHNERIEAQREGRVGLVAGHKKDVVLTNRLLAQPRQVAIFGWHKIQPLSLVHEAGYADYSHGIRLMSLECILDGAPASLADVFANRDVGPLLTHAGEGCLRVSRYP
jgi:hypothetical protein